jgi:hypothetical protein
MKKGDFIWVLALVGIIAFLVTPSTHEIFIQFTTQHPYYAGFVKFSILATMGELLGLRIVVGNWSVPSGLIYRTIVWGFIGMSLVLMFECFASGTKAAMDKGLLPGNRSPYVLAFFISFIMNAVFSPTFMSVHRICDTYLDLKFENADVKSRVTFKQVLNKINWTDFISFVLCRTVPFFWIPAHTIVFLLPSEYRVLMAAFLGIALGGILGFAKKRASSVDSATKAA